MPNAQGGVQTAQQNVATGGYQPFQQTGGTGDVYSQL